MADEEQEGVAVQDGQEEEKKERLELAVDIADAGPCRKHLKVTIPRAEIDKQFDKEFSELVREANVPGFRPGKTPRKLIERRYKKDLTPQVKATLLMQSLEQIDEEEDIQPLTQPNIDIAKIELPEDGDFVYEFEVEVQPDFELPDYKGLKVKKPVKEIADSDVEQGLERLRRRQGELVEKDGGVALGDYVECDVRFEDQGEVLREFSGLKIQVEDDLYFRDGVANGFAAAMEGATVGDSREVKVKLSDSTDREELRGKEIAATFVVHEVHALDLPEVDQGFFDSCGVADRGELYDGIRKILERRYQEEQRAAVAKSVYDQLLEKTTIELPQDVLRRQAEQTLKRNVIDLRMKGLSEDEIRPRLNALRQESVSSTATMLREQFLIQRIAKAEEIEIDDDDLEEAVRKLAESNDESVRRTRARIEQDDMWESIALRVLEEKTLDRILDAAEIEEVPFEEEEEVRSSGLDESAVPAQPETSESGESEQEPEGEGDS